MVQSVQHTMHSLIFLTVKPLFAPADSRVDMDRNENESAACVKGQRVCLCGLVVEEVKESLSPYVQLSLPSGAAGSVGHIKSPGEDIVPTRQYVHSQDCQCMCYGVFWAFVELGALITQFKT